ncbi:MAG TPA: hypothetical protein VF043_25090 [Ktedonobacteraceae bacterium]
MARSARVAVVSLEQGAEEVRDQAGVSTDQGRTWQKVCGLHELLASGREQVLDEPHRGVRMTGVVQHRRAETDGFPAKSLPRVGGEVGLSICCRQRGIAQVDLIGEWQIGQPQTPGRAQVKDHGVDLAVLELREGEATHLLRVGVVSQQASFEIWDAVVPLCQHADQQRVVAHGVKMRVVSPDLHSRLEQHLIPGDIPAARAFEVSQEAAVGAVGQHGGVAGEDHKPSDALAVGRLEEKLVHLGIGAQIQVALQTPISDGEGERHRVAGLALDLDAIRVGKCRAKPPSHERGK